MDLATTRFDRTAHFRSDPVDQSSLVESIQTIKKRYPNKPVDPYLLPHIPPGIRQNSQAIVIAMAFLLFAIFFNEIMIVCISIQ